MDLLETISWPPPTAIERPLAGSGRAVVFRNEVQSEQSALVAHWHDWHQLLYASEGVMRVHTQHGIWVVPPNRAVWIPAQTVHQVQPVRRVSLRNVYFDPSDYADTLQRCCVVDVSPLLRELVLKVCSLATTFDQAGADGRLVRVLFDQLMVVEQAAYHLPRPSDERLQRLCDALMQAPSDERTLAEWGEAMGSSERTLARLFQRQTGMSFGQWRQQARLLAALVLLAQGRQVVDVALSLGYGSQSAFIAMFRRATGTTPARYYQSD